MSDPLYDFSRSPFPTEPIAEPLLLDIMKIAQRRLGPGAAETLNLSVEELEQHWADDIRRMVYQLTALLLAEKLPPERVEGRKTITVDVPTSWWQHFKFQYEQTWWLGWFVRRHPARWLPIPFRFGVSVSLERYRIYPEAKIAYCDELGRPRRHSTVLMGRVTRIG